MKNQNKKAVIFGVSGQTGPYLAKHLLKYGYEVYGMIRQTSQQKTDFIQEFNLGHNFNVINGDITDESSIHRIIDDIKPDELYNLAALSHPGLSYEQPEITLNTTGTSVLKILEQIRLYSPKTRLCQISSADIFAGIDKSITVQDENTPIKPVSPYGVAKALAFNLVDAYVKSYNLYATNLICYNHESPRRSSLFVTKKITSYVSKWRLYQKPLELGNLDSKRDWGDVISFVKGMHSAMQLDRPENFVLSTGKLTSLRDFCIKAFKVIGRDIEFKGSGIDEIGIDKLTNSAVIVINPKYYRPIDHANLVGCSNKAKVYLQWENEMSIDEIIQWMVDYDRGLEDVYPEI